MRKSTAKKMRAPAFDAGEDKVDDDAEPRGEPTGPETDIEIHLPSDDALMATMERSASRSEWESAQPLLRQMMRFGLLTREEEIELITALRAKIREGDEVGARKLRDRMVYCNIRLVISIAWHYVNRGLPLVDLVQEGNFGVMDAIDRFELERGLKFSTYAYWWIRHAIGRAIQDQDQRRPMRVPVHADEKYKLIEHTTARFAVLEGRIPDDEELTRALTDSGKDMTLSQVRKLRCQPRMLAFDGPIRGPSGDENSTFGDFVADPAAETDAVTLSRELDAERREMLARVWTCLKKRGTDIMAKVLRYRFGIDGQPPMTLEEIGVIIDVTRERIRQIETNALRLLARHFRMDVERVWALLSASGDVAQEAPQGPPVTSPLDIDAFETLEKIARQIDENRWLVAGPIPTLRLHGQWSHDRAEQAIRCLIEEGKITGTVPFARVFLAHPPAAPNPFPAYGRKSHTHRAKRSAVVTEPMERPATVSMPPPPKTAAARRTKRPPRSPNVLTIAEALTELVGRAVTVDDTLVVRGAIPILRLCFGIKSPEAIVLLKAAQEAGTIAPIGDWGAIRLNQSIPASEPAIASTGEV